MQNISAQQGHIADSKEFFRQALSFYLFSDYDVIFAPRRSVCSRAGFTCSNHSVTINFSIRAWTRVLTLCWQPPCRGACSTWRRVWTLSQCQQRVNEWAVFLFPFIQGPEHLAIHSEPRSIHQTFVYVQLTGSIQKTQNFKHRALDDNAWVMAYGRANVFILSKKP